MEGTTTDEFPVCKVHKYSGVMFLTVVFNLAVLVFLDGRALSLHSCALIFLCFCSYLLANGWFCDRKRGPGTSFIPTRCGMLPFQCFLEVIVCSLGFFFFTDMIFLKGEIYNDCPPRTRRDLALFLLRWSILIFNSFLFMLVINQLMPPIRGPRGPVGRRGPSDEGYQRMVREYNLWRRTAPTGPTQQDIPDTNNIPSSGVSNPE
jgi:hypothetical protein